MKANATLIEIVDRMRSPSIGVGFLQQTVSLPSHTFVSIYAIHWLQANMENMTYEKATSCMEVGILIKRGFMVSFPIILKVPKHFFNLFWIAN